MTLEQNIGISNIYAHLNGIIKFYFNRDKMKIYLLKFAFIYSTLHLNPSRLYNLPIYLRKH